MFILGSSHIAADLSPVLADQLHFSQDKYFLLPAPWLSDEPRVLPVYPLFLALLEGAVVLLVGLAVKFEGD